MTTESSALLRIHIMRSEEGHHILALGNLNLWMTQATTGFP
jgi:hypothetical protein